MEEKYYLTFNDQYFIKKLPKGDAMFIEIEGKRKRTSLRAGDHIICYPGRGRIQFARPPGHRLFSEGDTDNSFWLKQELRATTILFDVVRLIASTHDLDAELVNNKSTITDDDEAKFIFKLVPMPGAEGQA